ncbi:hypothetical protein BJ875DRAFT_464121, partial [Amylocarpus encephaloides]
MSGSGYLRQDKPATPSLLLTLVFLSNQQHTAFRPNLTQSCPAHPSIHLPPENREDTACWYVVLLWVNASSSQPPPPLEFQHRHTFHAPIPAVLHGSGSVRALCRTTTTTTSRSTRLHSSATNTNINNHDKDAQTPPRSNPSLPLQATRESFWFSPLSPRASSPATPDQGVGGRTFVLSPFYPLSASPPPPHASPRVIRRHQAIF